jgi:hypothetical protein
LNNRVKESPVNINGISSYSFNKLNGANYSPISKSQTLFVVECKESQITFNKESNYKNEYCYFSSLMYSNNDKIELIEKNFYNQYALKDQTNFYKIKLQHESEIKIIYIDVITFSGEVNVIQDIQDGITCNQYSSINKIYLSFRFEKPSENLSDITFSIKAITNSYYAVLNNLGRGEIIEKDSIIEHELKSGISYLVTLNFEKLDIFDFGNKVVNFKKEKNYDLFPFMINFYSLNCEIEVHNLYYDQSGDQIEKILTNNFSSYTYDIINQNDARYKSSYFKYIIKVNKKDYSDYKRNSCKVYASAIELSKEHDIYTRDVLIPDNTPQQVMFGNNVTHVSYGYVNVNHDKDLLIKFHPYHIAQYKLKIYFNGIERKSGAENILEKEVIYIKHEEWANECTNNNTICYIQLDITLVKIKGNEEEKPILEFSINSIGSSFVSYIQKNIMKIDYVQNNLPQYYYTELGFNEVGFIALNFFKGSGKVYGKIINKNINEQNPDWRGKYKLPDENDIIIMDPFKNKAEFNTYNLDCDNECYLLLTIKPDVETIDIQINRNYPYSIIVHSYLSGADYIGIPLISIPLNQYVVGTVDEYDTYNRMFQFYSVWLNSDSEEVIINLQSEAGGIFINVGNERPTVRNYHFKIIAQGKDTIHFISRNEILKKGNLISLKNSVLTLGIWANSLDNVYTTPFAFSVSLGSGNGKDIYKVNSNQKTLCKTKHFPDGKNRCLYIIEDEMKNIDDRLKENNNDVEKAARKLEEKIKEKIDEVNKEQEKEVNSIIKEIENLLKDKLNEYYEKKEFSKTNINTNRGLTMKMVISLFTSAVSGIAVRSGLVVIAEAVIGAAAGAGAAGAGVASSAIAGALLGPAGVLIGLGVGVAISVSTFLFHWFNKTKRYISGLEESRTSLSLKFDEIKSNFTSDFKIFRESVINELNVKLEIISKDINKIDKKKWEEIKKNYLIQKKIIEKMIMNKLKD